MPDPNSMGELMDLNTVTDSLYDTILTQRGLTGMAEILATAMPGAAVALQLYDSGSGQCHSVGEMGFEPACRETYLEHYAPLNPWAKAFSRMPCNKVIRAENYVARDDLLAGEYYNDWLKPQGDLSMAVGLVLNRWHENRLILSVRTGDDNETALGGYSETLTHLAPHLHRISQIEETLLASREAEAFVKAGFEAMHGCSVLVDNKGQVLAASQSADALLAEGRSFKIEICRGKGLPSVEVQGSFRSLLAELGRVDETIGPTIMRDKLGNANAALVVFPVKPNRQDGEPRPFSELLSASVPAKLVIMIEPDQLALPSFDLLKAYFDLSTAETQLALALSEGTTLADYARLKDLSRNTMRNHLANVFTKTGVNRQVDLVRMVSALGEVQPNASERRTRWTGSPG